MDINLCLRFRALFCICCLPYIPFIFLCFLFLVSCFSMLVLECMHLFNDELELVGVNIRENAVA